MIKYLGIIAAAFLLTSCGPYVGENVYVGVLMPNSLGEVVGRDSESLIIKFCDGTSYKVRYRDVVTTSNTCPIEVTP